MKSLWIVWVAPLLLAGCANYGGGLGSSPTDCAASDPSDPIVVIISEPAMFVGYCLELNSNTLHDPVYRMVGDDGRVHFPEQANERYYAHVSVEQPDDRWCADQASAWFDYGGGGIEVTTETAVLCA